MSDSGRHAERQRTTRETSIRVAVDLDGTGTASIATGIGALLALAAVAGIAATFGRQLVARVPLHKINYVGAAVFAALHGLMERSDYRI